MPISYTNRKGVTYYLCQSATETGKLRYSFTRAPQGTPGRAGAGRVSYQRKREWAGLA